MNDTMEQRRAAIHFLACQICPYIERIEMSFYVKRNTEKVDNWTGETEKRNGWTGPIRSEKQAGKEAAAWQDAGWSAEVVPSTAEVRAEVRTWQKAAKER